MIRKDEQTFCNDRIIVFLALTLAFGILLGGVVVRGWSYLLFLPLVLFVLCFYRRWLFLALLTLVLAFGFMIGSLDMRSYSPIEGTYTVSGVVVEKTSSYVVLDSITLDGVKEKGKIRLYTEADLGERVNCTSDLHSVSGSKFLSEYANGVRLIGSAYNVERTKEFHLFLSLRRAIKCQLFSVMEEREASVAYALLTGDTSMMESELLSAVRSGGIAHLFAVSGLHIGILYGILSVLTLPIDRKYRMYVILPILFFYTGICSFSASSLRAMLMCAFASVNHRIGRRTDTLEALAFACLCMLAFSPAQIYQVGFRLSVLACMGITLLSPYLTLSVLPRKIAKLLSGTLSAQIAVFPILMDTFGFVSTASIVLNFVLVPLMAPLMSFLIIGLVLSPLSAIFLVPAVGILRGLLFMMNVSDFSMFLIEGLTFGLFILPYLFGLLIGCGLFNLNRWVKLSLSSILLLGSLVGTVFSSDLIYDYKIVSDEGGTIVMSKTTNLLILTEETVDTQTLLRKNRVKNVNVLFLDGEKILSFEADQIYMDSYDGDFFVTIYQGFPLIECGTLSVLVGVEQSDAYYALPEGKLILRGNTIME